LIKYFLAGEPLLFSTSLPTSFRQYTQEHYHLKDCQFKFGLILLQLLSYESLITLTTLVGQVLHQQTKKEVLQLPEGNTPERY